MDIELKEIRKMMYKQNEDISKEIDIMTRNEINSGAEEYNKMDIHSIGSTEELTRQKNESANLKIQQLKFLSLRSGKEERMEKIEGSPRDFCDIIKQSNIYLWESQKKKREKSRRIFEKIMAAHFLNLMKDMNLKIQELSELQVR